MGGFAGAGSVEVMMHYFLQVPLLYRTGNLGLHVNSCLHPAQVSGFGLD